tara:strand:+ start:108 stop:809 length:702 start_codon:yes stop_codon:yes gene_type:complete
MASRHFQVHIGSDDTGRITLDQEVEVLRAVSQSFDVIDYSLATGAVRGELQDFLDISCVTPDDLARSLDDLQEIRERFRQEGIGLTYRGCCLRVTRETAFCAHCTLIIYRPSVTELHDGDYNEFLRRFPHFREAGDLLICTDVHDFFEDVFHAFSPLTVPQILRKYFAECDYTKTIGSTRELVRLPQPRWLSDVFLFDHGCAWVWARNSEAERNAGRFVQQRRPSERIDSCST